MRAVTDIGRIEEAITEETGYVVQMEETRVGIPADYGIPRE